MTPLTDVAQSKLETNSKRKVKNKKEEVLGIKSSYNSVWKPDEIERLLKSYSVYFPEWERIVEAVGTKDMYQCKSKFTRLFPQKINYQHKWTPEEDDRLMKAREQFPSTDITETARAFFPEMGKSNV